MKEDQLVAELGKRLREVRKDKGLTLESLARHSKVSRSMLSQIERGETNPTFATLWNLTRALDIEFTELVGEDKPQTSDDSFFELVTAERTPNIGPGDALRQLRILSPGDLVGTLEWYDLTLRPGGSLDSQAHAEGTREHLSVIAGKARVTVSGHHMDLAPGDTLRYRADVPHAIAHLDGEELRAFLIVEGS